MCKYTARHKGFKREGVRDGLSYYWGLSDKGFRKLAESWGGCQRVVVIIIIIRLLFEFICRCCFCLLGLFSHSLNVHSVSGGHVVLNPGGEFSLRKER